MARNAEKANAMLNRWWAAKLGKLDKPKRRPRFVVKVTSLTDCEKWRHDVIQEISKNIAAIQNPTLPEEKVRLLNDEINKMIREKGAWERHIKSLGGPDYARASSAMMNDGGILGSGGYRYFGAAKNLPGVKDLLEERQRQTRPGESMKGVDGRDMKAVYAACDSEYFGYDDLFNPEADTRAYAAQAAANALRVGESADKAALVFRNDVASLDPADIARDEELIAGEPVSRDEIRDRYLALERMAERRLRAQKVEQYKEKKRKRLAETEDYDMDIHSDDDDETYFGGDSGVNVPSDADIDAALLARRKEALLKKYVTNKDIRETVQQQ